MLQRISLCVARAILVALPAFGGTLPAAAQNQGLVVRDGSLGAAPAGVVARGIDDLGQPAHYLIRADLGEQRGSNLFHSFEQFSIAPEEFATFTAQGQLAGQPSIDNVISRVTQEGSVSEIDGTLRSTIPGADVWLMNPNGIVFGSNARLDVPAGFHASTADRLELENGEVFEARRDAALPVLAVAPPQAFGFLDTNAATIEMADFAFLRVGDGSALSVEGNGQVTINGSLSADGPSGGGDVMIRGATVALAGSVSANAIRLEHAVPGNGGSILLEGEDAVTIRGSISASGANGGDITIRGATVALDGFGSVSADGFPGNGGSIFLEGEEAVTIGRSISASGGGGGDITIRGARVDLDGSVSADSRFIGDFVGDGGRILLEGEALRLDGGLSVEGLQRGAITLIGEIERDRQEGVVRDGSLGDAAAGVVPVGAGAGVFSDYLITPELGRVVGHNLFHSFSRFDLAPMEIANFTGPEGLRHIVARVTGNDPSELYGSVYSTAPHADLYLLNPSGIVFGEGVGLDVAGSFHVSTADRLEFLEEGVSEVFEARLDGAVPVTETVLPGNFGFLESNTAPIAVDRSTLFGTNGAPLRLESAGAVTIAGHIAATGGVVTIRGDSVAVEDFASINANGSDDIGPPGSVLLEGASGVTIEGDVSADGSEGGGDVTIRGGTISVEQGGRVSADAFGAGQGDGGLILLEGERLRLGGWLSAEGSEGGSPGTITLIGEIERDRQEGVVRDGSLGDAAAGVVPVGAGGGVFSDYLITPELGRVVGHNLFHSFSRFDLAPMEIANFTGPEGLRHIVARVTGNDPSELYGSVYSTAPHADLYLLNPSGIVFGEGVGLDVAGSFYVSTADRLEFLEEGVSEVFEARRDGAVPAIETVLPGNFGFLESNTAPIAVKPSTFLHLSNGALLSLEGAGAVTIEGGVEADGPAGGGDVTIRGDTVRVEGGVSAGFPRSSGIGGSILIEGEEAVTVQGGVRAGGEAGGGDITIRGATVSIPGGVSASSDSSVGGRILIEAEEAVTVPGGIGADGKEGGGDVTIRGATVALPRGAGVSAAFTGLGRLELPRSADGGRIRIEGERLLLDGNLSVRGSTTGRRGTITLIGAVERDREDSVVRDGSLGGAPGGVVPLGVEAGIFSDYLITPELGRLVGHNLFHSFSRFDLDHGEVAIFTGPASLRHIVARVTGNDLSEINGALHVTAPHADLYLLNPAGIVFGGGVALGVAGAFHASTADRLEFLEEGITEVFEARLDGAVPAIETGLPGNVGFLETNLAPIVVTPHASLAGTSLSLHGAGAVTIEGRVTANGPIAGDVTIRGRTLAVEGTVSAIGFSSDGGSVLLEGESVSIGSGGLISADGIHGSNGGNVTIRGGTISVGRASGATASGLDCCGANSGRGGSVLVEASGAITIEGGFSAIGLAGGGDVTIRGNTVRVERSGGVSATALSTGSGGSILVEGREAVTIDGVVLANGDTLAGDVGIHGGAVVVGGVVTADGFEGDGGISITGESVALTGASASVAGRHVDFRATDVITISNRSELVATGTVVEGSALGLRAPRILVDSALVSVSSLPFEALLDFIEEPGVADLPSQNVVVNSPQSAPGRLLVEATERLEVRGALLEASSFGFENAGQVVIDVGELTLDAGSIRARTLGPGKGGSVSVSAPQGVYLSGGAELSTSAVGASSQELADFRALISARLEAQYPDHRIQSLEFRFPAHAAGEAGDVVIRTSDLAASGQSSISSSSTGLGAAGGVSITAESLRLSDASSISAQAQAAEAGDVVLAVADRIRLDGGEILASASGSASGGDVELETRLLELTRGSSISAESTGSGDAGSVRVTAGAVLVEDDSMISVKAISANGGDVALAVSDRVHLVDSSISADVGDGTGGNITIDPTFVILDHSDIVARAGAGTGGEITIVADTFIKDPESLVSASAGNPSLSGTVTVNAPDVDLAASLAQLSDSALDASDAISPPCSARRRGETPGSFVFSGRQGVPPGPEGALAAWPGGVEDSAFSGVGAISFAGECR